MLNSLKRFSRFPCLPSFPSILPSSQLPLLKISSHFLLGGASVCWAGCHWLASQNWRKSTAFPIVTTPPTTSRFSPASVCDAEPDTDQSEQTAPPSDFVSVETVSTEGGKRSDIQDGSLLESRGTAGVKVLLSVFIFELDKEKQQVQENTEVIPR